jgi:PAS domain S-box-containing protein
MFPVNKVLSSLFISGMMFLAVAIAMIIFFSSRISTPIQRMVDMLKQVTQHSAEIILQIGPDRRILFANAAYEKATGLKAETLIGAELSLDNPANIPSDVIWGSLNAGHPWSGRVLMKKNDRETITLDVMLIPLRGRGGAIQGYLEIGRDVTQELMFEKRLQQRQKLEAIGTLAGGIAHDFNNILGGILGYAELSLMDLDPGQSGSQEEYLREIMGAAERARGLVNQILAFSRKTDVELKPLSPKPILKEALNLLRASIPATIQIESRIVSDSTILAEPTQIHQVVMNLFTNAVHAIGENPGTIQLELEDFWVDEEFEKTHPAIQQGKHVMLRISDTGCGIAPEILDHIFDLFFTTKPHGKGTGLGLSVVHGIVTRLGGIVTAYSELGKGSTFSIFVPCVDSAESLRDRIEAPIRPGTERIALIDDEKAIARSLQSILTNYGYKVTAFTDGMEALLAIKASPGDFDLIITDYAMPRLTGLSLAGELKKAGVHVPVILMSGFLSEEIEIAARNSGVAKILIKPISARHLTDAIHCAVRAE